MEQTVNVNIGGIAFILNNIAYNKLDAYLEALNNHYKNKPEGKEIIEDIESRIAELLLEKYEKDDVVGVDRIEEIIAIMGQPSDYYFSDEESDEKNDKTNNKENATFSSSPRQIEKKMFRNPEDKKIAGVCGGFARYFNIDTSWLRIGFVVSFILSCVIRIGWLPILLYVICWISIPIAKTVLQKCQMSGVDPGIVGVEQMYSSPIKSSSSALGGIIAIGAGIIMILLALGGVLGGWNVLINGIEFGSITPLSISKYLSISPTLTTLFIILSFLAWFIPCLLLLYLGIKITFGFKSPRFHIGRIMLIVWFLILIGLVLLGAKGIASFPLDKASARIANYSQIASKYYDTLEVRYDPLPKMHNNKEVEWTSWEDERMFVGKTDSETIYAIYPSLRHGSIESTLSDTLSVKDSLIFRKDTSVHARYNFKVYRVFKSSKNKIFSKKKTAIKSDKREVVDSAAIQNVNKFIKIEDSLIILYPQIISKQSKFSGFFYELRLERPDSSVLNINYPEHWK